MGRFRGNQHTENEYDGYEYEQLLSDVRSLASELDRSPTTDDAMSDDRLPCLRRIYELADDGWPGVLADAGLQRTQAEEYDSSERARMKADLRRAAAESSGTELTTRQYDDLGRYATSTVKLVFGTWAKACSAASVESGSRHGTACKGPNGERLESRLERDVARWLEANDVEYVCHPRVGKTNWQSDFFLPGFDLWVEVDGYDDGGRPNAESFATKLSHYEDAGMEYVTVDGPDVLEGKLLELGSAYIE